MRIVAWPAAAIMHLAFAVAKVSIIEAFSRYRKAASAANIDSSNAILADFTTFMSFVSASN